MEKLRIFLTGVGGQGTLTATNLLSFVALEKKLPVTSGEIHGMAQRGGIVNSTILLGGYLSPKIDLGEADIILGFEPLETLRALPYLKPGGSIVSNVEPIYPTGVTRGEESYPDLQLVKERCQECASQSWFVPCQSLALKAGKVQCSNSVLLGAMCKSACSPFTLEDLAQGIKIFLPPKIQKMNKTALQLGFEQATNA